MPRGGHVYYHPAYRVQSVRTRSAKISVTPSKAGRLGIWSGIHRSQHAKPGSSIFRITFPKSARSLRRLVSLCLNDLGKDAHRDLLGRRCTDIKPGRKLDALQKLGRKTFFSEVFQHLSAF